MQDTELRHPSLLPSPNVPLPKHSLRYHQPPPHRRLSSGCQGAQDTSDCCESPTLKQRLPASDTVFTSSRLLCPQVDKTPRGRGDTQGPLHPRVPAFTPRGTHRDTHPCTPAFMSGMGDAQRPPHHGRRGRTEPPPSRHPSHAGWAEGPSDQQEGTPRSQAAPIFPHTGASPEPPRQARP